MNTEELFEREERQIFEDSFADVCVPQLVELATRNRNALTDALSALPKDWPFGDKVLVFVYPRFYDDVSAFHAGEGKGMDEMFTEQQLMSVDSGARRSLKAKLEPRHLAESSREGNFQHTLGAVAESV